MQLDYLETLSFFLESHRVQLLVFRDINQDLSQMDYQFRNLMYQDYDYRALLEPVLSSLKTGRLMGFRDDFGISYYSFLFPESEKINYPYDFALIGPFLYGPVTTAHFKDVIEEKQIPTGLFRDLQEFYNRIPVIPHMDIWQSMIARFVAKLTAGDGDFILLQGDLKQPQSLRPGYTDFITKAETAAALHAIEERYKMEAALISAVANGDVKRALYYHSVFLGFRITPRTPDPIRNQKNLDIVLNTLLRKAVQTACVHPLHIDNLSTQMAIQIENCASLHQLELMTNSMVRKYCLLVQSYSRKGYSALIQACMDYIDFHYNEPLSLDSLARNQAVSNSYLSAQFRKETGVTLTDYINKTRIRQSLLLLNTTSLPVLSIAEQCGFEDSNYFTRKFKKYQGMSPKQYRDMIRGGIVKANHIS